MHKLTASDPETHSLDLVAENIAQLQVLFPEAFTEGRVDFDVLRQLLGGVVDEREEKYGLNWHGKRQARQLALTPSAGTLRPCPEESVDWDTTQNLMIEGDNLEVLKLLQKSYAGKVKLIYIDPPYNTGRDFVYPDNFRDSIRNYQEITGQVEGGSKISTNTEASGRFHTDWLNMMLPRLRLARQLLCEDGLMFVSIDDHELHNLLMLLIEVFGEENSIGIFVWQFKKGGGSDNTGVVNDHEYVICFSKSASVASLSRIAVEAEALDQTDAKGPYRRGRELNKWGANSRREDRPTMYFAIPGPEGEEVYPIRNDGAEGCWRWGKNKMLDIVARGDVLFHRRADGTYIVYEKIRTTDPRRKPYRTWLADVGSTADGSQEVKNLFDGCKIYDFPKPVSLIKHLISLGAEGEDVLVMDFFAGTSTTAQAVFELNAEDGGGRRAICIQIPEPTPHTSEAWKAGYNTIAEIGKERLRRAAAKIRAENPLFAGDLGFRVFKLDYSNIRSWEPNRDDLEETLTANLEHIRPGRTESDILYELLLKLGLDLCVPIATWTIANKTVYSVGAGVLIACLDKHIDRDETEPLALGIVAWHKELAPAGETTCVFRDSAFADDVAKTNLAAILQQYGLNNLRSL